MMNGVKTIEDIYRERSDVDQALDKVADPLQPADYNQLADLLSGAVIDECSFVYESAEDKSPAAIRMKCISSDGSEYFLQFGYDAFSDQAFSAFFHDPRMKVYQIWESAAGYFSLISQKSDQDGGK